MPVYNGEKYLEAAIRSILNQSFKDFELIIINDGSIDSSRTIVEEIAKNDSRVKLFNISNIGLVGALNFGLSACKYDYVARMDADDISLPYRFELQFDFLQKHPEVAVVGGQTTIINADGIVKSSGHYPNNSFEVSQLASLGSPVAHPAVMYRKKVVLEVGGYRDEFKHAEDYDLWLRILKKFQITNLKETILLYREHDTNVSKVYRQSQEISTIAAKILNSDRFAGRNCSIHDESSRINFIRQLCTHPDFKEECQVLGLYVVRDILIAGKIFKNITLVNDVLISCSSNDFSKLRALNYFLFLRKEKNDLRSLFAINMIVLSLSVLYFDISLKKVFKKTSKFSKTSQIRSIS